MIWRLFGGRSRASTKEADAGRFEDIVFPWKPHSVVRGNLAIGNIGQNLLRLSTVCGRIHCETLLATIGALTGFAAQNAALLKGEQKTDREGCVGHADIVLVQTANGERFLAGDDINAPLFGEGRELLPLVNFIAGSARAAGVPQFALPTVGDTASYVAQTLGGNSFGRLRVPDENQPHRSIETLGRNFWPHASDIFALPLPRALSEPELDQCHWPIVLSFVAGQLLTRTSHQLKPLTGYRIILESAVFASKIDPNLITPNRWLIEPVH